MIMNKKTIIIIWVILFLSFGIGLYFYPQIPAKMSSHWNIKGQVDGYMSKFWGTFLIPFILFGLTLVFLAIPRIDPLKNNIEKFSKYYDGFIIIFLIFMLSVHLQVILWNIGIRISPNVMLPIGLGLLFFYIGVLCENAKRNYFIGIRTPWTLNSDKVWHKTNKLGGKLFKIAGIIAFIGVFFRNFTLFFVLIPAILAPIYPIIYSYLEYQKETNNS
jgi:uncharacterized membrane protein